MAGSSPGHSCRRRQRQQARGCIADVLAKIRGREGEKVDFSDAEETRCCVGFAHGDRDCCKHSALENRSVDCK